MNVKINCWEFTSCGREPEGDKIHELGICPAAIAKNCDGIHGGVDGGRACWAISGTLCNGKLQGTLATKFKNCIKCEFYQAVLLDEANNGSFLDADQILALILQEEVPATNIPNDFQDTPFSALILSDNQTLNGCLRLCLEKKSFRVIEAMTPQDAAELSAHTQPDVILLTVSLPDMEGFATYATIRQFDSNNEIPVIFITTSESRALENQGFKLGALAVLHSEAANFWDEFDQKIMRIMRLKLRMSGLSALVLDTNAVSRQIITTSLKQQGVTVLCAKNVEEAKAIAQSGQTIDLVLAEVYNSEVNGLDLCRYLRKQPAFASTPIILQCPEQFRPKILTFFQAGATDYIIKPCSREELLARLLIHIESQQRLKELSQEVDKNKLLLDSVGEGIIGIDLNGHVTFVNQAAARLLGYLPAGLLGKNLHGLTHHTSIQGTANSSLNCPIQQSLEHGKIITVFDDVFWRSDNSTLPVKYISTPITFHDATYGAVVAFSDISAQKKDEALRQDIERITRHDLKTPLNAIIGIPGLLLEDDNLNERQRMFLEMLKGSGYRMLEMINESLNMFKMEKGTYELNLIRVDLLATIHSIQGELLLLKDKGIGLKITVDGKPSVNGQYFIVQGEELLCYSIFANLIKNAAEASPCGSDINISLIHNEPFAKIIIHNQGVVPEEIKGKFFEKYSTAGKSTGTGLGTYSAKLMTEIQKGTIIMTSDNELGTSLNITLPVN